MVSLFFVREVPKAVEEPEKVEKVEKKVVDVDADEKSNDEPAEQPKENGDSAKNGDSKETNGGTNCMLSCHGIIRLVRKLLAEMYTFLCAVQYSCTIRWWSL